MSKRIAIVGGGSAGWGPKLLSDLMLTPSLADSTFVLHDLNVTNAERIARFGRKLAGMLGASATIETETDPDAALRDADFILVTISTGGLDAMSHDLSIPEEYGIYHTVGDTVGPGGWARTMRNVPVFTDLAQRAERVAPKSILLNYTNPMAQLTKVLTLYSSRPAVGLCHGPFETLHVIQMLFGLEGEKDIDIMYGGVNHFFFVTKLTIGGRDGYELLKQKLAGRRLVDLVPEEHREHVRWQVASELYELTGMLTYMADRHITEFFPHYLTNKANLDLYRIKRTTVQERRDGMREREKEVEAMTEGEIPEYYRQRSRETAADIINAFVTGEKFVDVGNLPNVGQVENLPRGPVLETPVLASPTGFHPIAIGPLPEPVRTWIERSARVEDMMVQAALSGDLEQALAVLLLDPLCSHLNIGQVREMGLRLLRANARYLPQFKL